MKKEIKRVVVTGGAGAIAYNLLFLIGEGDLFGKEQPIALHILEIPELIKVAEGVKMELEDCLFPLLKEIHIGSDPFEMFKDADVAILVGAKPRTLGMERGDLLASNAKIFIEHGKALDAVAKRNVLVFVVGNPCNTNCLITLNNAPSLPKSNFHAMTRLDHNRAIHLLAKKAKVEVTDIMQMTIWGNHSSTQVADYSNATICGKKAMDVVKDRQWLEGEFIPKIQKRGAEVIACRGKSSAASAAVAIVLAVQDLTTPTKSGQWYSSAMFSEGNPYEIDQGLIFSFPCRTLLDGSFEIIKGLSIDPFILEKIKLSEKELIEERALVQNNCLKV